MSVVPATVPPVTCAVLPVARIHRQNVMVLLAANQLAVPLAFNAETLGVLIIAVMHAPLRQEPVILKQRVRAVTAFVIQDILAMA